MTLGTPSKGRSIYSRLSIFSWTWKVIKFSPTSRRPRSNRQEKRSKESSLFSIHGLLLALLGFNFFALFLPYRLPSNDTIFHNVGRKILPLAMTRIDDSSNSFRNAKVKVFTALTEDNDDLKKAKTLQALITSQSWVSITMNREEQRQFLNENGRECYDNEGTGNKVLQAYDILSSNVAEPQIAEELWKFCILTVELSSTESKAAAFLDINTPLIYKMHDTFNSSLNYAVFGDEQYFHKKVVHGSFLVLQKPESQIVKRMVEFVVETRPEEFVHKPLLLPMKLKELINQSPSDDWSFLKQRCQIAPFRGKVITDEEVGANENQFLCPNHKKYCCELISSASNALETEKIVMMTRYFLKPSILLTSSQVPRTFIDDKIPDFELRIDEDLPYITTIREEIIPDVHEGLKQGIFPSFYDIIKEAKCIPRHFRYICYYCLKRTSCKHCHKSCHCICQKVCQTEVKDKPLHKRIHFSGPMYKKDPNRFVPRIIHQTYKEEITEERHPNKSRLVKSWENSGWDYRFYSDKDARLFLQTHFPSEILEAFDALIPGAFKADLLRYCLLFIYGGVYADIDVLLETNLDSVIDSDVGFMIPLDMPGGDHRICLWNGFLASAPGHPFLAQVIELVVNNIRNRFTYLDLMNSFCPNPDIRLLTSFDLLFITGPCIIGIAVNKYLKRDLMTSFVEGTHDVGSISSEVPGKTVILFQNKNDMGSHRFTHREKNVVIASTDIPQSDDEVERNKEHYSSSKKKNLGIYGEIYLYHPNDIKDRANVDILFVGKYKNDIAIDEHETSQLQ